MRTVRDTWFYPIIFLEVEKTLSIYPREMKTSYSHKNMDTNVHSSFLCHSQTLKTTQISFGGWMDKLIHPHPEMLLSNRKELILATTWVALKRIMLSLKSQSEKASYYMILLFMWQSSNDKILEVENRLVVAKGDRDGGEGGSYCHKREGQGMLMVMDLFCI